MKRVAAYCRVSTDKEIQQASIELQMDTYKQIIASHEDWELAGIYADEGLSGTTTRSRQQFNRMIKDAERGKIDYILAKSISRFARNTLDTLEYTRRLKDLGVGIFFEEQGLDTLSATSEIFLTIHAAFAQEESHSISENMKHGMRNRVAMGIPKWTKTFGYRCNDGEWSIDPKEAEVIRWMYRVAARGMSLGDIAKGLKEQSIAPPGGAKEWHVHTIAMMLHNERYVGDAQLQRTMTVDFLTHRRIKNEGQLPSPYVRDHHEPIIDRETFTRVGIITRLRNPLNGPPQLPYYGLLKCPRCGRNMVGFRIPANNGVRAWACTCDPVCIREKYIDRAVAEVLGDCEIGTLYDNVVKIDTDFESITLTLKDGTWETVKLEFDSISEMPVKSIEVKDQNLIINGKVVAKYCGPKISVHRSLLKVRDFLKKVRVMESEDGTVEVHTPLSERKGK